MSKAFRYFLYLSVIGILFWTGCLKQESFSDVPEIGFQGFYGIYDTGHYPQKGVLVISFQDGNGDIGLNDSYNYPPFDSGSPYYYNFIINYYEKQNGQFVIVEPFFPLNARIPVLNPLYPGKPIKGTIADTLFLNPVPQHDTIRLEAYIYDRALNKSNVITTPELILRRP